MDLNTDFKMPERKSDMKKDATMDLQMKPPDVLMIKRNIEIRTTW